ncbi:hypothetical protein HYDPIDRAFT_53814, partial [Hydnomerulius pinastri MD-312]
WVRGHKINQVFSVEISSTKTVKVLKEVIKNKNSMSFCDIDALTLVFYKVSFPLDK